MKREGYGIITTFRVSQSYKNFSNHSNESDSSSFSSDPKTERNSRGKDYFSTQISLACVLSCERVDHFDTHQRLSSVDYRWTRCLRTASRVSGEIITRPSRRGANNRAAIVNTVERSFMAVSG